MERGEVESEPPRIRTHLVQRDESAIAVKGGILDALRHHRTRDLLEADAQFVVRIAQPWRQHLDGRDQVGAGQPDGVHGLSQVLPSLG